MTELSDAGPRKSGAMGFIEGLAAIGLVLVGILVLTAVFRPAGMDYVSYWSAGKLMLHHADPYSWALVFPIERATGLLLSKPLIMLNPPWALFLVAPLGMTSVREGLLLWTLVSVGCILASIWLLFGNSKNAPFALFFAPVIACLCSGQSSPFLLLGFALFLRLNEEHPFAAGASLLLMAIKPHLFLIFWPVVLVDCLYRRRYGILAGCLSALAAASAVALCFDSHVWRDYFSMIRGYHLQQGFLPTASMLLRMAIDVREFWLLFIPSALAVLWGIWYYSRWKEHWDWRTQGMLLMLVTIFVSPYGYFSDEIVLLPCIAIGISFGDRRKFSGWILLAINGSALGILAAGAQLDSYAYICFPAAWLGWFLFATHRLPSWWRKPATIPTTMREDLVN